MPTTPDLLAWVEQQAAAWTAQCEALSRPQPRRRLKLRVRPLFAWYDLWVGLFIDPKKRRVFLFLVPMLGLVFSWGDES